MYYKMKGDNTYHRRRCRKVPGDVMQNSRWLTFPSHRPQGGACPFCRGSGSGTSESISPAGSADVEDPLPLEE